MLYSVAETSIKANMHDQPSTILVADDHPLFREAMCDVARESFPNINIVEANSYQQVSELVETDDSIEMILLDLKMPGMNDMSGFVSLRNSVPATPVVMVTAEQDPGIVREAAACGAAGFINKAQSRKTMVEALKQIASGDVYFPDEDVQSSGVLDSADEELAQRIESLTQQQKKVLEFVASGLANKVIAYELGITESTVKAHVSAILRKLNVRSRTQLALIVSRGV